MNISHLKITRKLKHVLVPLLRKDLLKKAVKPNCGYVHTLSDRENNRPFSEKLKSQLGIVQGILYAAGSYALELLMLFYK
jgi:hypothetical protein